MSESVHMFLKLLLVHLLMLPYYVSFKLLFMIQIALYDFVLEFSVPLLSMLVLHNDAILNREDRVLHSSHDHVLVFLLRVPFFFF